MLTFNLLTLDRKFNLKILEDESTEKDVEKATEFHIVSVSKGHVALFLRDNVVTFAVFLIKTQK